MAYRSVYVACLNENGWLAYHVKYLNGGWLAGVSAWLKANINVNLAKTASMAWLSYIARRNL